MLLPLPLSSATDVGKSGRFLVHTPLLVLATVSAGLASPNAARSAVQPGWTQEQSELTAGPEVPELQWFEGSFEELMTAARASEKLVFLDFWAAWCRSCKKLEAETFPSAEVVRELEDLLCYRVDTETDAGRALAESFHILRPPGFVFLEPDGELRDRTLGFLSPELFTKTLQRVKQGDSTVSGLRRMVEESPLDLTLRWRFALKLRAVGDLKGFEREVAFLQENDPEGISIGSRTLRLRKLKQQSNEDLELQRVYDFLETEEDPHLLFEGWHFLFKVESHLADHGEEEKQPEHWKLQLAAARTVWVHVPQPRVQKVASEIVKTFLHTRDRLSADHCTFLVEISEAMLALTPEDPSRIAMHGVCLFTAGRKDEAIQLMHRAMEVDPDNRQWKIFLDEFESGDEEDVEEAEEESQEQGAA